jgi:hypothetical protein
MAIASHHMLPGVPLDDLEHVGTCYSVLASKGIGSESPTVWNVGFSNFSRYFIRNFCVRFPISVRRYFSPLLDAVINVVLLRSKKKVCRIAARRIVAFVKNAHSFWDWSIGEFKRYAMNWTHLSAAKFWGPLSSEYSIAERMICPTPLPASFCGLCDVTPKVFFPFFGLVPVFDKFKVARIAARTLAACMADAHPGGYFSERKNPRHSVGLDDFSVKPKLSVSTPRAGAPLPALIDFLDFHLAPESLGYCFCVSHVGIMFPFERTSQCQ